MHNKTREETLVRLAVICSGGLAGIVGGIILAERPPTFVPELLHPYFSACMTAAFAYVSSRKATIIYDTTIEYHPSSKR